jgi:hypothetical protein
VFVADRTDSDPPQPRDRVADRIAHGPDLTVASFVDDERQQGLRSALRLDHFCDFHAGGRRAPSFERDPARQPIEIVRVGNSLHPHLVLALDAVTWVRQVCCQLAVAGEQEQSLGVVIEPPDRVDVLLDSPLGQQIDHRRAVLRV